MEAQHLVLVFAGVLIGTGLALGLIWWYTTKDRKLADKNMLLEWASFFHRRVSLPPAFHLAAIGYLSAVSWLPNPASIIRKYGLALLFWDLVDRCRLAVHE
jgi:hypothetical protein